MRYIIGDILAFIGLVGLVGCTSDDTAEPTAAEPATVQLMSYVSEYAEPNSVNGITRSWTPPTGYQCLDELSDKSISVFFTEHPANDGMEEEFFFKRGDKWRVSKELSTGTTYYLYGYTPHHESIISRIAPIAGKTYADGAVLTLNNLPTITTDDICVIVGAKNGKSDEDDNGLTTGQFSYISKVAKDPGPGDYGNYIYLLFDHLYSCIDLRFSVEEKYNQLRTIKLKKVELMAMVLNEATGVKTPLKKKTRADITLRKTTDGTSPIVHNNTEQIVFTPDETSGNADEPLFTSAEGYKLTTSFSDFTGCFMSQGISDFIIRSTYDVYDKKPDGTDGNLIRENCVAENKLNIMHLFSPARIASRGMKYSIKLIVNPTYLYVLSEPDLDNPTIRVS